MTNMIRFAWGLIIASLIAMFAVASYFLFNGFAINLTMMVLPALTFVTGIVLLITDFGSHMGIVDDIENFEHHIGDDIQDFQSGYYSYTHLKVVTLIIAIPIEIFLIFRYQKWNALWGNIPVIIIAVIVIAAVLYGGITMNWFQRRLERTRWWVFALFCVGWAISAGVGTYYSEPIEFVETPRNGAVETINPIRTDANSYNWSYTRASRIGYFSDVGGINFDLGDCSGDDCGAALLFLVVVAIVIICVMASAMIPHFWVVATSLLLALMFLVTLRELLFSPSDSYKSANKTSSDTKKKKAEYQA